MTQITSIDKCNTLIEEGLVVLYGAMGEHAADQVLYLTRNDALVQKFTGMNYADLAEGQAAEPFFKDTYKSKKAITEGYCLLNRKRISVDLATMPGIAALVGYVVTGSDSIFSPFVDFKENDNEGVNGYDFLERSTVARCADTNEVVNVGKDTDLDSDFCYTAVIGSDVVRVNAFGYNRFGEVVLEPIETAEDYEPLIDQYIAQEGTVFLNKGEAPVFISTYMQSISGPSETTKAIKLKAYTIHHKDNGPQGIVIDLA